MMNIINSDIYRLRHSRGLRNTFIGLVITVLFIAVTMYFVASDGFARMLDSAVDSADSVLSQSDIADMNEAMTELDEMNLNGSAAFARVLMSSNFMPFFFLFFIMIFCSEFSNGTYRNTHSFEDNRIRVYFAKLLLNIVGCILMYAVSIPLSWLIGGIFFGFGGFSVQYFTQTAVTFLLMLPTQIAMVCLGHCIVAFAKKSGAAVAAYLIGLTVYIIVIQLLAMLPRMKWVVLLDWSANSRLLIEYWNLPTEQLLLSVCAWLAVAIIATVLGATHYRRADLH